jgi:signal transduction histidine kinase
VRRRLVLSTVAITVGALLVFGAPLAFALAGLARAQATAALRSEAEGLAAGLADEIARGSGLTPLELAAAVPPGTRLVLRTAGGDSVAAGPPIPGPVLAVDVAAIGGATLRLETSASDVRDRAARGRLALGALGLLAVAVAGVLAWLQSRRLAEPLADLAGAAARLGAGDFSARAPRSGLPEADTIADALDASAARIAGLVRAEREFSAHASHQLRSALTGLRLRLEALGELPDPEAREDARAALAQVDRLTDTVADLLHLARTGRAADAGAFDLAALAAAHLADVEPRLRAADRAAALDADEPVVVRAAAGATGQVLDVLLDNAVRHGAGRVRVAVGRTGGHASVLVEDEGPGVDPARAGALFSAPAAGAGEGHGIGLPLARTLVEADGGRLELERARPAAFRLTLPLDTGSGAGATGRAGAGPPPDPQEERPVPEPAPPTAPTRRPRGS